MAENPRASDQQISEAQRTSNALAQAATEARERKIDELNPENGIETVDGQKVGGRYKVNGQMVGPNGKTA